MITEAQPNETLDGRLQIEGVISRSGMASIYKAKDLMTGQAVAVKIPTSNSNQIRLRSRGFSARRRSEKSSTILISFDSWMSVNIAALTL